ncbi:MAG: replication-relaxation family protein [Gammaproteobacteria bacterium]|nr:replication-relaxation family protein [Gammaproteobacteria bacterium]
MLEFFLNHPWIITDQVARVFYSHCKNPAYNASKRLKCLYDVGLLWRTRPFVSKGKGTHQFIFCITRLAYNLLSQVRHLDYMNDVNWQEYDNVVEMSRIVHELELNELCISLMEEAFSRNIEFTWTGTRCSRHKVSSKTPGGKSYVICPDSVIRVEKNIFHVEYERYCDKDNFYKKCVRLKRYRQERAWKELYPVEPIFLIVGNKEPGETIGHHKKINSIDLLFATAKSSNLDNIYFLYNEDWRAGNWKIFDSRGNVLNLFSLSTMDNTLHQINGSKL